MALVKTIWVKQRSRVSGKNEGSAIAGSSLETDNFGFSLGVPPWRRMRNRHGGTGAPGRLLAGIVDHG